MAAHGKFEKQNWKPLIVFEIYLFQIQTPSFEKLGTKFIIKVMFCGLKLSSCFSGGFLLKPESESQFDPYHWFRSSPPLPRALRR